MSGIRVVNGPTPVGDVSATSSTVSAKRTTLAALLDRFTVLLLLLLRPLPNAELAAAEDDEDEGAWLTSADVHLVAAAGA